MTDLPSVESGYQIITFLWALGVGAALYVLYDFFVCMRIAFDLKTIFTFFLDTLFGAISGIIVYCFMLIRCYGRVRIFALIGCILGFILFRIALGKLVFKHTHSLSRRISSIIKTYLSPKTKHIFIALFKKLPKPVKVIKKALAKTRTHDV